VPWELLQIPLLLPGFVLVLARVSGLLVVAPILGSSIVPVRVRAFFALVVSLMLFPSILPTIGSELTLSAALLGLAGELMIGIVLGLGVSMLFVAMELAGLMISQQAGLALAEVIDPVLQTQGTPLGRIYFICAIFIFLIVGGLRAMVQALLDSFATLPLLSFAPGQSVVSVLVGLLTGMMIVALRLAGPALTALLLTSVAMGFISRTMPQLNILAVGFSIRIGVAFTIVAATVGAMEPMITTYLWDSVDGLVELLRHAG
jgi:flagellar biosynthetic protein FliR